MQQLRNLTRRFDFLLPVLMAVALAPLAAGVEWHVSPQGNDAGPGTKEQPFATLEHARDAVRASKQAGHVAEPVTVWLHGGTYQVQRTLVLGPEDSGTQEAPVRYRAAPGETPVVSGGHLIKGWKLLAAAPAGLADAAKGKVWAADIPKGWRFHYLYMNGERLTRAQMSAEHWRKWPGTQSIGGPDPAGRVITFADKDLLKNVPSNGDAEMVVIQAQYGVMGNIVLTDVDAAKGTARWNSRQLAPGTFGNLRCFNIENALPFLDQPGEWCVDSAAGKVYLWPVGGTMENKSALAPVLNELVRLQGNEANNQWVHHVGFSGNVIWVEGSAACGTIGVRPSERGNVIHDNIRAAFNPAFADGGGGNLNGIAKGFYKTDTTRAPVYQMIKAISEQVAKEGGWPGNPKVNIPAEGVPVKPIDKRIKVKMDHVTIE